MDAAEYEELVQNPGSSPSATMPADYGPLASPPAIYGASAGVGSAVGYTSTPRAPAGVTPSVKRALTERVLAYASVPREQRSREGGSELKRQLDAVAHWSDENYSAMSGGWMRKSELESRLSKARSDALIAASPVLSAQEREALSIKKETVGGFHVPTAVEETKKEAKKAADAFGWSTGTVLLVALGVVLGGVALVLVVKGAS